MTAPRDPQDHGSATRSPDQRVPDRLARSGTEVAAGQSNLQQRPMAQFILTASCGLLGEVPRLLTKAAEAAITTCPEQLSLDLLETAAYGR